MANKKISQFPIITSADLASEDIIPVIDVSAVEAEKNKKMTVSELVDAFTALGTSEVPLLANKISNGTFNGFTGWSWGQLATGTVASNTVTFTAAGDIRQTLRQFNANDSVITISAEMYSPTQANQMRLYVADDANLYYSPTTPAGSWGTVVYEVPVTDVMKDKATTIMIYGEAGTKVRNVKLTYNGDSDTINKALEHYTTTEIQRTKYFQPDFEGKRFIAIGDSFFQSGMIQKLCANTGMIWLEAEQHNPDVNIGTQNGGVPIQPVVAPGSGLPSGWSAYMRADNLAQHSPDVIWLHAGSVTFELQQPPEGYDIWQPAYTGGEEGVQGVDYNYITALKGTLKKITEQNPSARVYLSSSIYFNVDQTELTETQWKAFLRKRDAHKAIAALYSVVFLETLTGSGIHLYNKELFAPDGHMTAAGSIRMADFITTRL